MKIVARHRALTACRLMGAACAVLALSSVLAQSPPPRPAAAPGTAPAAPASPGGEPTIERIRIEDAGSRIDELRIGGETQQIVVQPKTAAPAYEVNPAEGARGSAPSNRNSDTNGSRVWNLFRF